VEKPKFFTIFALVALVTKKEGFAPGASLHFDVEPDRLMSACSPLKCQLARGEHPTLDPPVLFLMVFQSPIVRRTYKRVYDGHRKFSHKKTTITLRNKEYDVFASLSQKAGISVPKMVIRLALASARKQIVFDAQLQKKLDTLIYHDLKIGNNINQIARDLNIEVRRLGKQYSKTDAGIIVGNIFLMLKKREELLMQALLNSS
jgi:Bacterial mobilisation protein (MobC)